MMRKALITGTMDAVSAVRMFLSALIRPKSRTTLQKGFTLFSVATQALILLLSLFKVFAVVLSMRLALVLTKKLGPLPFISRPLTPLVLS